MNRISY